MTMGVEENVAMGESAERQQRRRGTNIDKYYLEELE
jgi:hypothetical protein